MNGDEEHGPLEQDFDLPGHVKSLLENLGAEEKVLLQAYLEINNHHGEYPLHLVLEGLEKFRPGTIDEIMSESVADSKADRENQTFALRAEVTLKALANFVSWGIAIFGVVKASMLLSVSPLTFVDVAAALILLVFCIGGPLAAARFAGNSGININRQNNNLDDEP
ncbi:MAG: hypothetical protein AAGL96_09290 [Pseudomonadota bacterium]